MLYLIKSASTQDAFESVHGRQGLQILSANKKNKNGTSNLTKMYEGF